MLGEKMNYNYVLFDLDGTLTDSAIGITNAAMYSLKKFGIEVTDRSELYRFVGPPLWDSFKDYYGFSDEDAKTAVEYFREYYKNGGMFENMVYPGCEDLLKNLQEDKIQLIVATSKYELFAKQILEHFDLAKYFYFIAGCDHNGTRVKKEDVIEYALKSCDILPSSNVIMIGDREHDIIGAKKIGIPSIGVLYGYGNREELEQAGADYIAETVEDIGKIILNE
jgi:haloacid dehalogenase superfamily, subfamily IA, variant 1 with third motif having Dx(3-4)D or Dx(3-4)E